MTASAYALRERTFSVLIVRWAMARDSSTHLSNQSRQFLRFVGGMAALRLAVAPGDENTGNTQAGGGVDVIRVVANHHRLGGAHLRQGGRQMLRVRLAEGGG